MDVTASDHPRTLLVGIHNPATIPALMALAAEVHQATQCEVIALHIVTVAAQMNLVAAQDAPEIARARELLHEAVAEGARHGVGVNGLIEVGRETDAGIVAAVESRGADLLLLGYSESPGRSSDGAERAFDRLMHRVARRVTCDVIVAKFRRDTCQSILVPMKTKPLLSTRGLVLRAVAQATGAEMHFLHVLDAEEDEGTNRAAVEAALRENGLDGLGPLHLVRATEGALAEVISRCNAYDLVLLGAQGHPSIAEAVFGTDAERIASETTCSLLIVREHPKVPR